MSVDRFEFNSAVPSVDTSRWQKVGVHCPAGNQKINEKEKNSFKVTVLIAGFRCDSN